MRIKTILAALVSVTAIGLAAFGEGEAPIDAKIPMTVVDPVFPDASGDPDKMIDGTTDVYFSLYNFTGSYAAYRTVIFNFGGPKTLTRMRACSVWTSRFAFSFYVSTTGADGDWVLFAQTTNKDSPNGKNWVEFAVPEELAGQKFHYAKIQSDDGNMPGCAELEFYTTDSSLTFAATGLWAQNSPLPDDGIRGKFVAPTELSADIYCYAAATDLGEDIDEWKANGEEFLVAENVVASSAGTPYSGTLPELELGRHCLRVFAVSDSDVTTTLPCSLLVCKPDAKISMKVVDPVVPTATGDPNRLVDGSTDSTFSFYDFSGSYASIRSFVLDFGGLMSITRMRACTLWFSRFAFSFYVSETGADDGWILYAKTTDSSSKQAKQWLEFPVPEELAGRKFRYAKIQSDNGNNPGCAELEFYSTDLSLTFTAPDMWMQGTPLPEAGIQGVFTGPGVSGANVFCYAAKEDFGADYEAWKENGQEFLLASGVTATLAGTPFSGALPELDVGRHYLCVAVVDGEDVTLSPARSIVVGVPDARIPMTVLDPVAPTPESDPHRLVDGGTENFSFTAFDVSYAGGQYASIRSFVLDFGGQKSLTRMRALTCWQGRFAFSFYVSATGEDDDWHLFRKTTDMMSTAGKLWLEFPVPDELADEKFRYAKIESNNGSNPGCAELEFYTTDRSLSLDVPTTCDSFATMQPDAGICIQGKFFGVGSADANMVCCVAAEDLGEDYAAWTKKGQVFSVTNGLVAASVGEAYGAKLTGVKKGYCFLRTFAVAGANVEVSPVRHIASQAVPAAMVRAYVTSKAHRGDGYSATWVNGVIDDTQYESAVMDPWNIFDLKPYNDAGLYVSGVRLFARDNVGRRLRAQVEWAYDDSESPVEWMVEQNLYASEDGKRTLDYVLPANVPTLEWRLVADALDYSGDPRIETRYNGIELTTLPAAQRSLVKTFRREGKLPRYLRVGKVQSNALVEIELRLSKIPPGAFAIVVK